MAGTTSKLAPFTTRRTYGSIVSRSASASARRARGLGGAVLVAGLLAMASLASSAQAAPVPLGEAANFAVLAGSTVTNTGPSVISGGHVGVSPGSAVTGFGPGTVTPPSTIHRADSIALQAKNDLTTAYDNVAGRAPGERIFADLAGRTLEPGVYTATSSLALNGDLTLDAKGDPNAEFIFQAGSTLLVGTTTVSAVRLINEAQASNVYWQVGSSATIGVNSALAGNILALTSITMQTNTSLNGRALARNGAVTLETTTITTPAAAGSPGPECVIPDDAALHAVESPTAEGHFPSEEWIAHATAQAAVESIGQQLDAVFGVEGAEGADPLRAGLIGVASDDYAKQFVIVVDPSLVDVPSLKARLRSAADSTGAVSMRIRVSAACRSAAALAEAEDVVAARSWSADAASATFGSDVDANTSTINVTFGPEDQAAADALKTTLGDTVTIEQGTPSLRSRTNDGEPHWGGAGIHPRRNESADCTSAFTVRLANGSIGSTTAGHCYTGYRSPNGHSVWSGSQYYGRTTGFSGFPRFDMIAIRPDGERFSNKIHTDPGRPSARTIVSKGDPARGRFVCASGVKTRAVCGAEVTSTRTRFCDPGGCSRNLFKAVKRGQLLGQGGDSGAPVYNRFGDAGAAARGMEIAGTRRDNLYAHKISSVESHLNVRVLGG